MAIDYRMIVGTKIDGTDIQQQIDKLPVKKIVVQATVKGSKEIKTMTDDMGNLVTTTTDFDKSGKNLGTTLNKVSTNFKDTSNQIKTASTHTTTLAGKFVDITKKVVAFGAVTSLIGTFTKLMYEAVESVKVMDESLTELKKVTDLSGGGLENYTDQAFAMARDLKTTASDVTDAVTEFAKSNYTLEESQVLAKQAIIFQTIADGAVSASDSATMLIQVMKAYGMTVSDSVKIVDSINEVSNKYAVSSTDLSSSIGRVASSAKMAGVDFNQLLGLITGSNEIVQNAGKTANGYKTILTNLMTKDLEKQFNEFNLTMLEQNGELKSGYDMLIELGQVYNSLGTTWSEDDEAMISLNSSMNKLMKDIAGSFNINVLTAGFQNVETTINATESAMNSAGSASDEYAIAMDKISKKTDALKGSFQELVWGDGGLQTLIKGFLDAGTGILQFINKTDAINVILVATGVILGANLIPKLILFGTTLITNIGQIALFTAETGSLSAGLKAVGISASVAQIALGGVIAVLTIGAMVWNGYKSAQEEAERATKESISSTLSEIKSLEQISKQLEDETLTREALYSLIKGTDAYSSEMEDLEDVNELRQEAIDKIKEEQILRAKQLVDTGLTSYQQAQSNQQGTQTRIEAVSDYKEEMLKFRGEYAEGTFTYKDFTKSIASAEAELSKLYARQKEDNTLISDFDNALSILGKKYDEVTGEIVDLTQAEIDNTNKTKQATEEQEKQTASTEEAKYELSEYEEKLKDLDATLSILSGTSISGLSDAFEVLKKAQEEINNTGKLSIDNYEELMSLGAEYQAILFDENGQLRLNEESIQDVYNAKIDEMAITSARNMIDLAVKLSDEGKSFADLANDTNSATVAGWEQIAVMMAELELSDKDSKALQVRINGIKDWAEQAKKSVGTYSQTTKAISTQTKAIDEQKEALDKLKDEYKAVAEYIKDQLDSEISRIEDAKSAELDRIDAVIDSLKKKRDAEEDYWDNRISALEEQNKAIEKQIELEQLQENLALARNKKVMVMGANGWEIREDEQAVVQAEQDIADYTRKQQAQTEIDVLNKLKETALANYDSQIQAQEEFRARQESAFDAQIAILEGHKTEYNNMVNAYEEEQNRLLALQVLGTDFENQTWQTRLSNLQSYVNRYNSLQASLGGSVVNSSSGSAEAVKKPTNVPTTKKITSAIVGGGGGGGTRRMMAYASGVASVPDDGIAITGDNPSNRELVIGSKANGTLMNLAKGTGVVNAESTRTFAGMLNSLSKNSSISGLTSEIANSSTNNSNTSVVIQNVTLPSVTNAQSFVDEIRGFSANMTQYAYSNG